MKILISSHFFAPSVGGIEQVSGILAEEFVALGHDVRVITQTPTANEEAEAGCEVFRRPSLLRLIRLLRWCDVYLQSNISVSTLWPALLLRKPTVIVYHTWVSRVDGGNGWQDWLKRGLAACVPQNLAVSRSLAASISKTCGVIPNPYRDNLFAEDRSVARNRDLVFLGRLVSDKGADILLDALALLRERGPKPTLTVIGTGPDESALKLQADKLGLDGQISFLGKRTGVELVRELNRHRIIVIPSRWREPFGLIALEGLACGLVPVGADDSGLVDAIGPCGVLFERGNAHDLAAKLGALLNRPEEHAAYLAAAPGHLVRHGRRAVAEIYLEVLREVRA